MLNNWNDTHTEAHKAGQRIATSTVEFGRVTNVSRDSILTGNYDVEIFGMGGVVARGCRQSVEFAGFDGAGRLRPLLEGTPVVVAFKSGRISEGIILGSFFTSGDSSKYLEGEIAKPGDLADSAYGPAEFNQRSLHPSIVAQPHAFIEAVPGVPPDEPYNDPAYQFENPEEARRRPVAFDITTEMGDRVRYTSGVNVDYSDRSRVELVVSDNSDCAVRLLQSARIYVQMASLWTGTVVENLDKMADIQPAIDQILEMITKSKEETDGPTDNIPGIEQGAIEVPGLELPEGAQIESFTLSFPESRVLRNRHAIVDEFRAKKELDLAIKHLELAKSCVSTIGSIGQQVNALVDQFGSTNGQAHIPNDGLNVPQVQHETPNKSRRREKPTIVILHETVGDLQSSTNWIKNPESRVSYHAIVARDGTIHRFVPDDYASWGAGGTSARPSVFVNAAGQAESGSVNHIGWNFSFESPPMQNQNALAQHTGYTEAQYKSMAKLVHATGVPANRITTHAAVDRTGERSDPRNFDVGKFTRYLNELRGSPQVLVPRMFPGSR